MHNVFYVMTLCNELYSAATGTQVDDDDEAGEECH